MDSGDSALVTAALIQMRAEIFSFGESSLRGVLYGHFLETPFQFTSLLQMIEKMEEIFDSKGFPEAFMTPRVFEPSAPGRKNYEIGGKINMNDMINSIVQPEPGGSKCTFEISVKFRQNATWQGQILWAEKNLKQNFRSVLEMLKLMDEAIAESAEKSDNIKWTD